VLVHTVPVHIVPAAYRQACASKYVQVATQAAVPKRAVPAVHAMAAVPEILMCMLHLCLYLCLVCVLHLCPCLCLCMLCVPVLVPDMRAMQLLVVPAVCAICVLMLVLVHIVPIVRGRKGASTHFITPYKCVLGHRFEAQA